MAVEIEAKLKVDDLEGVRQQLRERSAVASGVCMETNTFFDTEDRSLLAADQGLRLRVNRGLRSGTETFVLTFKGPCQHGPLKSREEFELTVNSAPDATALLGHLGYGVVLEFEKQRESWQFNDCRVELDELPLLGTFVEIEGPDQASVLQTRQLLQLGDRPIIKASYVAMLMDHLQEHGIASRQVRFQSPRSTQDTPGRRDR